MAPISYYYLISLALVGGGALWFVSLLLIRIRGVTILGKVSKKGTPSHDRLLKLASNRNIWITSTVLLILVLNLIMSALLVLGLKDQNKFLLLIGMPIVIAVVYILGVLKMRKDYKYLRLDVNARKITTHKDIGKDDSWLS